MMSTFGEYSKYYDLLYKDKDYKGEAQYINSIIQKYNPATESIFEMGCGTGKHSLELAKNGYRIKGIDLSDGMLSEANKKVRELNLQDRLSFEKGDVRSFRCDQKFDTCISLFHVMSYQTSNNDLINAFQTAAQHLKQGGVFIFDCWYGPAVLTERPSVRVKRLEDSEVQITRIAEPVMYANENVVDVNYEIIVNSKRSEPAISFKETHKMRYLFLPEIKLMLEGVGINLTDYFEYMTGKVCDFYTWSSCIVGSKK